MTPLELDRRPPVERAWSLVLAIRARRAELDDLRTASDARAAYEAAFADEEKAIAQLARERDRLELERRRRLHAGSIAAPVAPPPTVPVAPSAQPPVTAPVAGAPPHPAPATTDRRRLKKLVGRWAFAWQLDAEVVGHVNGIADDADRPLGEALALLGERAFRDPLGTETPEAHAARLAEWHHELQAYHDWLDGEIATVQLRYRGWLGVWRRWRAARDAGDGGEGAAEWARFLESTREVKRGELAALGAQVAALRLALDRPAARP